MYFILSLFGDTYLNVACNARHRTLGLLSVKNALKRNENNGIDTDERVLVVNAALMEIEFYTVQQHRESTKACEAFCILFVVRNDQQQFYNK